jgi:hypothetical protein
VPSSTGAPLALLRLDPGARGEVAGTYDPATGVLSPARTSWRIRPVAAERRAYLMLGSRRDGVDLALERFNGWRRAAVPLLVLTRQHEACQPAPTLRALADDLARRGPRDVEGVVGLLRAQADHLDRGGDLRSSPLSRKIGGGGSLGGLATG